MDSDRVESLEARRRRMEGLAIWWHVYIDLCRARGEGRQLKAVSMGPADYKKLCLAAGNEPGGFRLIETLYDIPIFLIDNLAEGVVITT